MGTLGGRAELMATRVQIEVISGKNLPNNDVAFDITQLGIVAKPSDPYVICSQGGKEVFRTAAVKDSANPEWNHKFSGGVDRWKDMTFTVYDEDTFKEDDYLGTCTVPVASKDNEYTLNASDKVEHRKLGGMDKAASKKKSKLQKEESTLKIKVVVEGDEAPCGECVVQ